jgi:hypothetical protein
VHYQSFLFAQERRIWRYSVKLCWSHFIPTNYSLIMKKFVPIGLLTIWFCFISRFYLSFYLCNGQLATQPKSLSLRLWLTDKDGKLYNSLNQHEVWIPFLFGEKEKFHSAVPLGEPEKPQSDLPWGLTIITIYKTVRNTHSEILVRFFFLFEGKKSLLGGSSSSWGENRDKAQSEDSLGLRLPNYTAHFQPFNLPVVDR